MQRQRFGAFGKMPSAGDFFRLSLSQSFVAEWDEWLQRCLLQGSELNSGRWNELYMSAPIWRFCLSPGLAGPQKVLGVLMPSVDRVGRRFPLTLAAPVVSGSSAFLDHFNNIGVFEALERVALDALDDDMSRDRLDKALSEIAVPSSQQNANIQKTGNCIILIQENGQNGCLPDLASGLMSDSFRNPSIWSTVVQGGSRLMVCEGLPSGPKMQGLFNLHAEIWAEAPPT